MAAVRLDSWDVACARGLYRVVGQDISYWCITRCFWTNSSGERIPTVLGVWARGWGGLEVLRAPISKITY